jgi:uncharacterized membrane protein
MPSTTGLDENVAGLLCYLGFLITAVLFLVIERKSEFVKFHAMQSLMAFAFIWVLFWIVGALPLGILTMILFPLTIVLWILLMVKAYQKEKFKLPLVGDWAEKATR